MISGEQQLYFGTSDGETFAFDADTFSDDGNPIAIRVKTKKYYLSNPNQLDEIQRVFVFAEKPQAANISISLDNHDYEQLGSIQETEFPVKFDLWEKCHYFSLGIDEMSSNNIEIKGFNIYYESQSEIL